MFVYGSNIAIYLTKKRNMSMRFFVSLQTIVPQRPPAWQEFDGKGTGVYSDLNNCHASYLKHISRGFPLSSTSLSKETSFDGK